MAVTMTKMMSINKLHQYRMQRNSLVSKNILTIHLWSKRLSIIENLKKRWTAPIYAFFKPDPLIEEKEGKRLHVFQCNALHCKGKTRLIRRNLGSKDAKSTSNLRAHAKVCWGEEIVMNAQKAGTAKAVCTVLGEKPLTRDGSIMAAFECEGKGSVTYSYRQHTKTEARYVAFIFSDKMYL